MKLYSIPALDRSLLVTTLLLAGFATTAKSAVISWTGTTGNWSDATWSGGTPPDAQDASAAITIAGAVVDLGSTSRTVGSLQIGANTTGVTVSSTSGGSLIFSSSAGNATLTMATVTSSNTISAPITLASSVDVTVGASTSTRILTLSGKISGSGGISIKSGVGKLQLNNSANDFSGGVTIETGGTLSVLGAGAYLGTGNLTINGGGIQTAAAGTVNVGSQTWSGNVTFVTSLGALSMGTSAVDLNGGVRAVTLSSTIANRNATVGGVISNGGLSVSLGSGSLASSLVLTGANTYAGGSTVNSGTLATSTTGTFGAGNVTVATGAFLTAANATSFADQATLTFASTSTSSSIALNFTGADTLGAVYDSVAGTYLTAGTYTTSMLNGFFGGSVFTGTGSLTVSAIPEPSTCAVLLGSLAMGATFVIRRRRV